MNNSSSFQFHLNLKELTEVCSQKFQSINETCKKRMFLRLERETLPSLAGLFGIKYKLKYLKDGVTLTVSNYLFYQGISFYDTIDQPY